MADSAKKNKSDLSNKKISKKDRHSKINTAHGPRDRRMRLSLDVARKFFGLQDILGFDKASKTVEWLLTKSKPAIKEHINSCSVRATNSASSISTSDCEVLSGLYESTSITFINGTSKIPKPTSLKGKKMNGFRSKPELFHPLAREMRDKARARARERTREKMRKVGEKSKVITCTQRVNNVNECSGLRSWTHFENGAEESGSQIGNTINHSFETSCNWSPSTFFGGQHNPQISHENQFVDLQVCGKPWDAYK